jgi:hypothetical protein
MLMALLVTLLIATNAAAQGQTQPMLDQATTMQRARIKIWTGITLMAVGAIALPITAAQSTRQDNRGPVLASVGAIGAGSGLVYWGFQQQRRATAPSTSFGFTLARARGVVVRRSW